MNWVYATKVFVITIVCIIIAWDIIAYKMGGVDATISRIVLRWASAHLLLALGIGIYLGHQLWSQPPPPKDDEKT